MFKIDTGERFIDVTAISASVEETQIVHITNRARAINLSNKITEAIQAHECPDQLDDYWQREDLILDALALYDPHVMAYLQDLYEEHRAALIHGGAYRSAQAVPQQTVSATPTAHNGNNDKEDNHGF